MGDRLQSTVVTEPKDFKYQDFTLKNGKWVPGPVKHLTSYVTTGTWNHIEWDSSRRSGKLKRTRACGHHFAEYYSNGAHQWKAWLNAQRTAYRLHGPSVNTTRPSVDLFQLMEQCDVSVYANEALDFFKAGCVEQELDLTTNIFELKHLSSTFDFLKKRTSKWKKLANGHLAYSFGIKPLLADLSSFVSAISSVEKKVRWFRKNQGKIIPIRYTRDVTDDFEVEDHIYSLDVGHKFYRRIEGFKATYTAFALITYDVSSLSDIEIRTRNLIRSFGVDNPLGIIWENIPYSFLVDWLFSVGDWLNAIAPKVRMPYVIHDVGTSMKLTCDEIHKVEHGSNGGEGLPFVFERTKQRAYRRLPGLKLSFGGIAQKGDLSLSQLALALSLAIQKYSK